MSTVHNLDEFGVGCRSKRDFLLNLRIARDVLARPRIQTDSLTIDRDRMERPLARAAIWLSPKAVEGFHAGDFPELGDERLGRLRMAIAAFLEVANAVPDDGPASIAQIINGRGRLEEVLELLEHYIPTGDEEAKIESALRRVSFPEWIVNWRYELGSDMDDRPTITIVVYADDETMRRDRLGRTSRELIDMTRLAFEEESIDRWPYVRMTTVDEYRSLARTS